MPRCPARAKYGSRIDACGVCRTDLHIVDGELHAADTCRWFPATRSSGHVDAVGPGVDAFAVGDRVGIPWLGATCGVCPYCREHRENLCDAPQFTGYTRDGGYADMSSPHADYCFRLPAGFDDVQAAPLLCAGLIGYRACAMAGDARRIGIYGFGAAAHMIAQVAVWQEREVYAFTGLATAPGRSSRARWGAPGRAARDQKPPAAARRRHHLRARRRPGADRVAPRRARAASWSAPAST